MEEKIKKSIDESWKETISKEKQAAQNSNEAAVPDANFSLFVSTLTLQASISLGTIPNPVTKKTEKNLTQAKFIIDTLSMIKDKTVNNLDTEEQRMLENALYELRMQYVNVCKEERL